MKFVKGYPCVGLLGGQRRLQLGHNKANKIFWEMTKKLTTQMSQHLDDEFWRKIVEK